MLLEIIITLGIISLVLLAVGFFLEPINPYLILFASMIILMIALGSLKTGIEVKTGEYNINSTPIGNQTITKIDPVINKFEGLRADGIIIILILLSLYLGYFSIDEILGKKYGESNVK